MYVQQKYTLLVEKSLNVFPAITTLFSGMSFAATDIFFEVVMAGTAVKMLRMTILSMPRELHLLFKISINLCHFFFWANQFSRYEPHKTQENIGFPTEQRLPITRLWQYGFSCSWLDGYNAKTFQTTAHKVHSCLFT